MGGARARAYVAARVSGCDCVCVCVSEGMAGVHPPPFPLSVALCFMSRSPRPSALSGFRDPHGLLVELLWRILLTKLLGISARVCAGEGGVQGGFSPVV